LQTKETTSGEEKSFEYATVLRNNFARVERGELPFFTRKL